MNRTADLVGKIVGVSTFACVLTGMVAWAVAAGQKDGKTKQSDGPAAQVASARSATSAGGAADSSIATLPDNQQEPEAPKKDRVQDADILRVLEFARDGYERMTKTIRDYTCIIYRREPLENPRDRAQYIFAKIRHEQREGDKVVVPFSVYLRFLKPDRVKGREVIYVRGRNHGDLIARRGGRHSPNMTFQLDPDSPLAMEGNRYPVTEVGIKNLTKQLIGVLEKELTSDDCEVKTFRDAKLNNRPCTHFQVRHTERRPGQRYYMARVLVDDELKIPVYFASYDWPKTEGGKPRLLEEYAYSHIQLNVGLTDEDFDIKNPKYHFKQLEPPPDDVSLEPADNGDARDDASDSSDAPESSRDKSDQGAGKTKSDDG